MGRDATRPPGLPAVSIGTLEAGSGGGVELFVVAGGEGGAALGESGELALVEGWEASPDLEVRWVGDGDVSEVESDEALHGSAEPGGGGAE